MDKINIPVLNQHVPWTRKFIEGVVDIDKPLVLTMYTPFLECAAARRLIDMCETHKNKVRVEYINSISDTTAVLGFFADEVHIDTNINIAETEIPVAEYRDELKNFDYDKLLQTYDSFDVDMIGLNGVGGVLKKYGVPLNLINKGQTYFDIFAMREEVESLLESLKDK